jgi:NAD(P)-dependent dehydrogenase (short-subunit alcohol dehydrogenase family)
MEDGFKGKVALVTGGASGIGRAIVSKFAAAGIRVVIVDLRVDEATETESIVSKAGGEARFIRADLSRADDVEAVVKKTVATFGRLDYACNNAGVLARKVARIAEFSEEDWDRVIENNLKSVFLCLKYELRQMLAQGCGSIVNTASNYGLVGAGHGVNAYVASKHGVVGLTKAAALEYAEEGIRVNAVCPGHIETPLTREYLSDPERREEVVSRYPVRRLGTAEEIASAVLWLCSDDSSFVTGHALAVDGGYLAR